MKKLFSLIEILIVSVIISFVFLIILIFYTDAFKIKVKTTAWQELLKNSYISIEKINILMSNYTIDYEEYFNRKVVGCNTLGDSWNGINCSIFTNYGNGNLYYCSSLGEENFPNRVLRLFDGNELGLNIKFCYKTGERQAFLSYKYQHWDMKSDINGTGGIVGDDDDIDMGVGPIAINPSPIELYLISKDNKKRIFLRRALISSGDFNNDGKVVNIENLYDLQILRLRGFDMDFNGRIDTWACDYGEGFICKGNALSGAYRNYRLASDVNDGWVNLFGSSITFLDFKLDIYPLVDYRYYWKEQLGNPYIIIKIKTGLYGGIWGKKIPINELQKYTLDLQTTFNIKNY